MAWRPCTDALELLKVAAYFKEDFGFLKKFYCLAGMLFGDVDGRKWVHGRDFLVRSLKVSMENSKSRKEGEMLRASAMAISVLVSRFAPDSILWSVPLEMLQRLASSDRESFWLRRWALIFAPMKADLDMGVDYYIKQDVGNGKFGIVRFL